MKKNILVMVFLMSFLNLSWGGVQACFTHYIVNPSTASYTAAETHVPTAYKAGSPTLTEGYCFDTDPALHFTYTAEDLFNLPDDAATNDGYTIKTTLPEGDFDASDASPQISYSVDFTPIIANEGVVSKYSDDGNNGQEFLFYTNTCPVSSSGYINDMTCIIGNVVNHAFSDPTFDTFDSTTGGVTAGDRSGSFVAINGGVELDVTLVLRGSGWQTYLPPNGNYSDSDGDGYGDGYFKWMTRLAMDLDVSQVSASGTYTIATTGSFATNGGSIKLTIPDVLVLYHPEKITLTLTGLVEGGTVTFDSPISIGTTPPTLAGTEITTPNSFTVTIANAWAVRTLNTTDNLTVEATGGGDLYVDGDASGTTKGKIVIGDVTVSDDVGSDYNGTITYDTNEIGSWSDVLTGNLQFTMNLLGVKSAGKFVSTSGSGQINITVTQTPPVD